MALKQDRIKCTQTRLAIITETADYELIKLREAQQRIKSNSPQGMVTVAGCLVMNDRESECVHQNKLH